MRSFSAWYHGAGVRDQGSASVGSSARQKILEQPYVPNEIVVRFRAEKVEIATPAGSQKVTEIERGKKMKKKKEVKGQNAALFQVGSGKTVEGLVEELRSDPNVLYAEPNYVRTPFAISTNDTLRSSLWALDNTGQTVDGEYVVNNPGVSDSDIDAPEAWAIAEGTSTPVVVAVIDSGVAYNHPDLVSNMWDGAQCLDSEGVYLGGCVHGYDFEDWDTDPVPVDSEHGTLVAGIISSGKNNGRGVIGIAPHAKIMALRFGLDAFSEVQAIDFAIQNGARVINASYGGYSYSQMEYDAIQRFRDAGGLFVAAAGNFAEDNDDVWPMYPASYDLDNIITVAATDQADVLADFSNFGSQSVDVGAPGTNILTTTALGKTYEETFEGSVPDIPAGWTREGVSNNWGTVTHAPGDVWGRVGNSLYADLSRPYASGTETSVTSPVIDLSNVSKKYFSFSAVCDTEYATSSWEDYMELSFDSGAGSFLLQGRWDEVELDWRADEYPLSDEGSAMGNFMVQIDEEYYTDSFRFRFEWVTNENEGDFEGCSVDDVRVLEIGSGTSEEYQFVDGTSFSAPYIAGLAALMLGYNGGLTYGQLKQFIEETGDSVPSLAGTTVTGRRVNARNALEVVTPYFISTSSEPVEGGSVVCTPNPVLSGGESVCESVPNTGYVFSAWSGDCTGGLCVLENIVAPKQVTAHFSVATYTVSALYPNDELATREVMDFLYAFGLVYGEYVQEMYDLDDGSLFGVPASDLIDFFALAGIIQDGEVEEARGLAADLDAGVFGSTSPPIQTVTHGGVADVLLHPDPGYLIYASDTCGGGALVDTTYTTGSIMGDCSVAAVFTRFYAIGGTVSGLREGETVTLEDGFGETITLDTDASFEFTQEVRNRRAYEVKVRTQPTSQTCVVEGGSGLVQGSAVQNIAVTCAANIYTVSASAGAGGTIAPSSHNVTHGSTTTFSVQPASGYRVNTVTGCGGLLSDVLYTTAPITAHCSVVASFTRISSGGGGGGSSSGRAKVVSTQVKAESGITGTTSVGVVPTTIAHASSSTRGEASAGGASMFSQLVELLIALGIISPERAEVAREFVRSFQHRESPQGSAQTTPVVPAKMSEGVQGARKPTLSFTRDLKMGDSHPEVLLLQRFLNARDFPVATVGPGSPGSETDYFGPGTRSALIRFQELYRTDVLYPIGLADGDGVFRGLTRSKANEFLPRTFSVE